jgi:hypothetical protein
MTLSSQLDQDALTRILRWQLDVLTREQAVTAGVTRHALEHRLRSGGPWRRLLPGVYVAVTGTPTIVQQQMAALLYAGPGSMITGPAAATYHRIRVPASPFIDVLLPIARRRRDAAFVQLHRTARMPERISPFGPLRYVLPARAVADTVRGLDDLREVRAIVADAVQRDHCSPAELGAELAAGPHAGSALFREALTDIADRIRSTTEADLKDLLTRSGLPRPLYNPMVFAGEDFIASPDAWWPDLGVAVEVDSTEWHLSPADHAKTLARGRRMAIHQLNVLRFTPKQIHTEPARVAAEIRAALDAARDRPPPKLRTVTSSLGSRGLGRDGSARGVVAGVYGG